MKTKKTIKKISVEVALLKRFLNFHNKVKDNDQVLQLLSDLQKAIINKRIRKTSHYVSEIEYIQTYLINLYYKMGKSAKNSFPKEIVTKLVLITLKEPIEMGLSGTRDMFGGKFEIKTTKMIKGQEGVVSKRSFNRGEALLCSYETREGAKGNTVEDLFEPSQLIMKVNHSDEPNAYNVYTPELRAMFLYASKKIMPGDEITTNYQDTIDLFIRLGYKFDHDWLWFKNKND